MINPKDNPPAFPPNAGWRDDDADCRGATLLDYFAAKAMQGMYSNELDYGPFEKQARTAYNIAEAMLAERKKRMEK